MSDDDSAGGYEKIVFEATRAMDRARTVYFQERAGGRVTDETAQALHSALLRYYNVLRRFRDEDGVEDDWPAELEELDEMIDATTAVEIEQPGRGKRTKTVERPARVRPERAVRLSQKLDDVAHTLGFTANVDTPSHRAEITDDLIEEVEEWRKQNLEQ